MIFIASIIDFFTGGIGYRSHYLTVFCFDRNYFGNSFQRRRTKEIDLSEFLFLVNFFAMSWLRRIV